MSYHFIYIYIYDLIGRVFANNRCSISGRVMPKNKKWYLMPPCLTLSTIKYVSRVKWRNQGKGVAPSPMPCCSSNWKGNSRVALDYRHKLYFYIYIYIYIYIMTFSLLVFYHYILFTPVLPCL